MMRLLSICGLLLLGGLAYAAGATVERLPNGFRLVTLPTTTAQVVSVELLVDYSELDEPLQYAGLRQVLLASMLEGSATADGATLRKRLIMVGGKIEGRLHNDMLEFSASVPANQVNLALNALAETVCRPALTDAGIQAAITQAQREVAAQPAGSLDSAFYLANQLIYAGLPSANDGRGSAESLACLTPTLVRAAYQSSVSPAAAVMAVVGRCDPREVQAKVRAEFAQWSGRVPAERRVIRPAALEQSHLELREAKVNVTSVLLTFPACGAVEPDFLPLRLIDTLLGGGTGSRLFRDVREEQRLAYSVSSAYPSHRYISNFTIYALTDSSIMEEVKKALVGELSRLQVEPVTDAELQRAKAYLRGQYLLSHQYSAQHAFDLAWYEMIGLGPGYEDKLLNGLDGVTPAEIQRVARAYFTRYYLIVVLPQVAKHPANPTADRPLPVCAAMP